MSAAPPARSGPRSAIASVVAAALCIPAVVGVVLLTTKANASADEDTARRAALHAAGRIARDILSYDYRTIDQDLARAQADSTGEFARQYASTADGLRAKAKSTQAIVQARVRDTGVVTGTSEEVVVLVFADQISITRSPGAASPTAQEISSAVQLTLTERAGRWRVSALSAVQTGAPTSAAG